MKTSITFDSSEMSLYLYSPEKDIRLTFLDNSLTVLSNNKIVSVDDGTFLKLSAAIRFILMNINFPKKVLAMLRKRANEINIYMKQINNTISFINNKLTSRFSILKDKDDKKLKSYNVIFDVYNILYTYFLSIELERNDRRN